MVIFVPLKWELRSKVVIGGTPITALFFKDGHVAADGLASPITLSFGDFITALETAITDFTKLVRDANPTVDTEPESQLSETNFKFNYRSPRLR